MGESFLKALQADRISEIENTISQMSNIDEGLDFPDGPLILQSKPSALCNACFFNSINSFRFLMTNGASSTFMDKMLI